MQNRSICWRCHAPIEYLQVKQWFIRIMDFKKEVLAKADEIEWFPEFMKVRLQDWVNSLQWDWVVSRQRYFATPIPVWECQDCDFVLPAKETDCYIDPTVTKPYLDEVPQVRRRAERMPGRVRHLDGFVRFAVVQHLLAAGRGEVQEAVPDVPEAAVPRHHTDVGLLYHPEGAPAHRTRSPGTTS